MALQFEDKVEMTSTACAATDGVVRWRVHHVHDPLYRLDVSGDPPPELEETRARLFREQEEGGGEDSDADFIHDVPIEIAKAACGYRADEVDETFLALAKRGSRGAAATKSTPAPARWAGGGFLARLFSGFRGG